MIFLLLAFYAMAGDDLTVSMKSSASGMKIQGQRMKLIAENIANANVPSASQKDPYRRKVLLVKNEYDPEIGARVVKKDFVVEERSEFLLKYEPHHPAADERGYVKYPNVNVILENVDAKEAQRTYEANLTALEIAKENKTRLIELLK